MRFGEKRRKVRTKKEKAAPAVAVVPNPVAAPLPELRRESKNGTPMDSGPPSTSLVGGVFHALHAWVKVVSPGAARVILPWLKEGVRVRWVDDRPPDPFIRLSAPVRDPRHKSFLNEELQCLLEGGMIREIPRVEAVCSSPARVEPKRDSDKLRLVVNYRGPVNDCAVKKRLRLETLSVLPAVVRSGDWLVTLDLRSGYHHFRFHPSVQPYLGFNILDRFFEPVALNFGFTLSPYIFHKIVRQVVRYLRQEHRVRMMSYLDDFLLVASTYDEALETRETVCGVFQSLGLQIADNKGQWEPVQELEFLGVCVGTNPLRFRAPKVKVQRVAAQAQALLNSAESRQGLVSVRQLQQCLGLMSFLDRTLRPCKLRTRELFNVASREVYQHAGRHAKGWPRATTRLTVQAKEDLLWWAHLGESNWVSVGRPIAPPCLMHAVRVYTDAAGEVGWGGTDSRGRVVASGNWGPEEQQEHITLKEMRAVLFTLQALSSEVSHRRVLVLCDNMAVVRIIAKGSSRSPEIMEVMRELFKWAVERGVQVYAKWVPTDSNPADAPSRSKDGPHGQMLDPDVFHELDVLWGPHHCDRFASAANAQLPRFHTRNHDPRAEGIPDAFAHDWASDGEEKDVISWVYPPFPLIARVICHIRECQANATLVVPDWPAQPWHTPLLEEAEEVISLNEHFGRTTAELHSTPSGCVSWFDQPAAKQASWHLLAVRLKAKTCRH